MKKNILVMCSGGDAPGMNACVYYLTKFLESDCNVIGVIGGFDGLIRGKFLNLSSELLKPYLTAGGSFIKAGRSEAFLTDGGMKKAKKNYDKQNAECMIVLGGNGSYKACIECGEYGIKTISIPATIDNDLSYSDISLGFDSAVNANIHYIKNVSACCYAQSKIPLVEIMGRDSGKLTAAVAGSVAAEIFVVPEEKQREEDIIKKVRVLKAQGESDFLILVTEKLFDVDGLADRISSECKVACKAFKSGYFQRGGDATGQDILLSKRLAEETVLLVKNICSF